MDKMFRGSIQPCTAKILHFNPHLIPNPLDATSNLTILHIKIYLTFLVLPDDKANSVDRIVRGRTDFHKRSC